MDDKNTDKRPATELEDRDLDQATGGAASSPDRESLTGADGKRTDGVRTPGRKPGWRI